VPFVLGAALGVPIGVTVLTWADPSQVRTGVGAFLVLYSLYALLRAAIPPVKAGGMAADAGVGFLNGVLGGITGLAGILVTIWCGLRERCWSSRRVAVAHESRSSLFAAR
jgi:uncharacterized protein